ncbi:MAG: hypothetical protein ACYDBB_18755 [Armatimonadota bacterium]
MVTKPRRWKRGVLVVALVLLVAGGIWWWRMPRKMHVIVHLPPLPVEMTQEGTWTPVGLYIWSHHRIRHRPWTLALYDWNGAKRWSTTVQEPPNTGWYTYATGYSPDGHWAACMQVQGRTIRVLRWHDGQALSEIRLPWATPCTDGVTVHPTDSGRVWVVIADRTAYRLWALDGAQIASGLHTQGLRKPGGTARDRYRWRLSPDGTLLACENYDRNWGTECLKLAVRGKQVLVTQRYTLPGGRHIQAVLYGGLVMRHWGSLYRGVTKVPLPVGWEARDIDGSQGRCLTLAYDLGYGPLRRNNQIWHLPSGTKWSVPLTVEFNFPISSTPDGQFVLMSESGIPRSLMPLHRMLDKYPTQQLFFSTHAKRRYLALYKRPDRLLATFSTFQTHEGHNLNVDGCLIKGEGYILHGTAVSPNGKHVGLTLGTQEGQPSYAILGW